MRSAAIAIFAAMATTSPCFGQTLAFDKEALVAAAERAADEAERASSEAEKAMISARRAAFSARAAAAAARQAAGMPAVASGEPASAGVQTATNTRPADVPPPDENLPVKRPAAPVARASLDTAESDALRTALASSVANGPNDSPLKSSPTPDFQLVAASTDKVASVSWTLDVSGQSPRGRLNADQLTLTASAKLDDSGDSSILGLDGFNNGTEIKLAYTHYNTAVNLSGREKDPVRVARQNCLASLISKASDCDPYKYGTGVSTFVSKWNPTGLRPLLDEVLPQSVLFYGLNFTGNQASYKYLDRTLFSTKKDDHFGFGAGIFGGVLLGHGETSITGSFDYRRSYDESDPITLCQSLSGTTQTQCITAADGAPSQGTKALFGLELRHAFPVGVGHFASFALAPRFTADVENDAYSLALPLYFVGDDTGKLRGGIRGVYLNKKATEGGRDTDFTLGLFVGVPFSAFQP
jgi:hypothetical protein